MFASKRVLLRTIERMQHDHAAQIRDLLEVVARLAGKPLPPPVAPPRPEPQGHRDDDTYDL